MTEKKTHFGNNFYYLFEALRTQEAQPDSIIVKIYLRRAEELAEKWQNFLTHNQPLLQEIYLALEKREAYSQLLSQLRDLLKDGSFDEADQFEKDHNLASLDNFT